MNGPGKSDKPVVPEKPADAGPTRSIWELLGLAKRAEGRGLAKENGEGVDGALPGIVMLAHPKVGDAYRQEFFVGEAEDLGEVLRTGAHTEVRFGAFDDVLVTKDWNPLEPDIIEEKYYAPGVGLVRETKVAGEEGSSELVSYTPGA